LTLTATVKATARMMTIPRRIRKVMPTPPAMVVARAMNGPTKVMR
jgi:hypothetical protein